MVFYIKIQKDHEDHLLDEDEMLNEELLHPGIEEFEANGTPTFPKLVPSEYEDNSLKHSKPVSFYYPKNSVLYSDSKMDLKKSTKKYRSKGLL